MKRKARFRVGLHDDCVCSLALAGIARQQATWLVGLLVLGAMAALTCGSLQAQGATGSEEFVGPFATWRRVRCVGQDDTRMLQQALTDLGTAGHSPVLFIEAGTCRITAQLELAARQNVTILGADPATTKILWAGPAGGTMLWVNGVGHARFGRLTWDGGGTARTVYELAQKSGVGFFATGNRHEDEWFQHLDAHGMAVRVGDFGIGDAETQWVRCHFIGPMDVGILLKDFNVLDYWVWDSEFDNLGYGVANNAPNESGAGGFAVNRSNFLDNIADMSVRNTEFFSSRWNYSRGSKYHVMGNPIGSSAAPWTSQGETVIDPSATNVPWLMSNAGPLGVLDDTVRAGGGLAEVSQPFTSNSGGDLWALGNTLSSDSGNPYTVGSSTGRLYADDDAPGSTITDPGPPALPPTPPASAAPVIEVQGGDIAAALAEAGDQHVIVHIPYGTYTVAATLEVGPNVILTGDGLGATQLMGTVDPILHLAGPSHAILRDFSMSAFANSVRIGTGVVIDNADQPGGLVHIEDWVSGRSDVGFAISDLSQTIVDSIASQVGSNTRAEGNGAHPSIDYKVSQATLHIFMGAGADSDVIYQLSGGELVAENMFYQGGIHGGLPDRLIGPSSTGTLVIDGGNFASAGGIVDASTFRGLLTITDFAEGANGVGGASAVHTFGPNSLLMGYLFGWKADSTPPSFLAPPYAQLLARHNDGAGGTDLTNAADQTAGIADVAQFVREHLAPLRAAQPLPLVQRPIDVTDVRIYRVGGELMKSALVVSGPAS